MRVVFMGTPQLAATVLERLADEYDVVGVFTRPDAVRGRGRELVASPVKKAARRRGIDVHTPEGLRDAGSAEAIAKLNPDVICVAAYGAILPANILAMPRYGCLNVHTSLLPRWRGAAPIERAILERDEFTGVCIMRMEEGLDTGPYCTCVRVAVGEKYLDELTDELAQAGACALVEAIGSVESGDIAWMEQAADGITYARKIAKSELVLEPGDTSESFAAKVRASSASRPSRLVIAGRSVAVERAKSLRAEKAPDAAGDLPAGEATFLQKRLIVGTREGLVELERLRPDGKKSMDARAFAAGIQGIKNARVNWGRP